MYHSKGNILYYTMVSFNKKKIKKMALNTFCDETLHIKVTFEINSYISTLSTFTPQGSVASSSTDCIWLLMLSLSVSISPSVLVPSTFLSVVAASNRVLLCAFSTLVIEMVGLWTL